MEEGIHITTLLYLLVLLQSLDNQANKFDTLVIESSQAGFLILFEVVLFLLKENKSPKEDVV